MNTPGYHRYMRGMYFFFGMLFAQYFHSMWLLAVVAVLVVIRAVYDIIQEEQGVSEDIPPRTGWRGIFDTPMNWDEKETK